MRESIRPTLEKYFDVKVNKILLHPVNSSSLKLKDIWLEFVEYKRKTGLISETTYQTCYNRTFANWLAPYLDQPLSYELAEKMLTELLESGVNKANLKKLISALKEACDRSLSYGSINRNFFANLGERIKKITEPLACKRNTIIATFQQSKRQSEKRIAALVEFLFLTGCRLGEAFALKWGDIKTDWIVFDESYSSETKITKSTKTDTIRIFRRSHSGLKQPRFYLDSPVLPGLFFISG